MRIIKRALEQRKIEKYYANAEKEHYIYNTWGKIEAEKGFQKQKQGDLVSAEMHFNEATRFFYHAKKINPSDSYPYFTEAYILLRRGNRTKDNELKLEFYSIALSLLEIALDYIEEVSYDFYLKTKMAVLKELQQFNEDEVYDIAKKLAQSKDVYGYYILAQKKYNQIEKTDNDSKNTIEEVLRILDEGLSYVPVDSSCLNLKIKILQNHFSTKLDDMDYYYGLLNRLFSNENYINPKQLYDYALLCFKKGYYDKSKHLFNSLRQSSKEISRRYMVRDKLEQVFDGEIFEINKHRGWAISINPHIKYKIYVNPLKQKHLLRKGDSIKFHIAFNYMGPIAVDIELS